MMRNKEEVLSGLNMAMADELWSRTKAEQSEDSVGAAYHDGQVRAFKAAAELVESLVTLESPVTVTATEPNITIEVERNSRGHNWRVLVQAPLTDRGQIKNIIHNTMRQLREKYGEATE